MPICFLIFVCSRLTNQVSVKKKRGMEFGIGKILMFSWSCISV